MCKKFFVDTGGQVVEVKGRGEKKNLLRRLKKSGIKKVRTKRITPWNDLEAFIQA